jgi:hypothetical protein
MIRFVPKPRGYIGRFAVGRKKEMETYEIVGLARVLGNLSWDPYIFKREIGPCSENEAVIRAYDIVAEEERPKVAEYRLLRKGWTAKGVPTGIHIHTLNVPICDECWKKSKDNARTHYQNTNGPLERCSICGNGTTNGLFVNFC